MADDLHAIVQRMIDAGESEDNIATVIKGYTPTAQPMLRSRTGTLYTPPAESGLKENVEGFASGLDPRNLIALGKAAYHDPMGTAINVAKTPLRLVGGMVTQPARTLGELGSMAALGIAGQAAGSLRAVPPEMIDGVSVADLRAAGVKDPAIEAMRQRAAQPKPTLSGPRLVTRTAPPPTQGNLAMRPEFQPVDAPVAQPTPSVAPQAVSDTRQAELLQKFGGMMREKGATLDPQPAVTINPKAAGDIWAGKLTPEQVAQLPSYSEQARSLSPEWHSYAEPGSAEAKSVSATHKYEAEMANRWKYLMDSEKGIGRRDLIANPVRALSGFAAEGLARAMHAPIPPFMAGAAGWFLPDAATGVRMAAGTPAGNAAIRAALLAQMTAGSNANGDTGSPSRR